jgi:predicted dehydrogenase
MEDQIVVPRDWFPGWAPKSSPGWFLGVHFYDLVRWILKSNATRVYATGVKGKLQSLGVDTYDSIQAKVEFDNGASVTFDTSWILPENFEAIVNQGLRLVGSEGAWEVDTQDRGCIGTSNAEGMRTYNTHFLMETKDKKGRPIYSGYGISSILDFAENVAFLKDGGTLKDLAGSYPSGEDGREVTRIAVAVHESVRTGEVIKL